MKVLQKILMTFAVLLGLAMAVSAQKGPKKPPPPKQDPPVVTPQPKNPPRESPKPKPKKPSYSFVVWKEDVNGTA